jgi:hypothetical protein
LDDTVDDDDDDFYLSPRYRNCHLAWGEESYYILHQTKLSLDSGTWANSFWLRRRLGRPWLRVFFRHLSVILNN